MQKKNTSLLMACAMFLVALLVSYTSVADAGRKHDQDGDHGHGRVERLAGASFFSVHLTYAPAP